MIPNAMKFGVGSASRVNVGNCGGTDPTVFTMWAWVYLDSASGTGTGASRIMAKGAASGNTGFAQMRIDGNPNLQLNMLIDYTTTDGNMSSANNTLIVRQPQFVSVTVNGTASAPRAYTRLLNTPVTEVSYATQVTPVGTRVTDGGNGMNLGNGWDGLASPLVTGWPGWIYAAGFINGIVLDRPALQDLSRAPLAFANMHSGMWLLGANGTGSVIDVSGRGFHGAITSALPVSNVLPIIGRRRAA